MKPKERDDLLIRLDERVGYMRDDALPAIVEHLAKINNHLDDHSKRLVIVETKVNERTTSKVSKKAIAGYGGTGSAIVMIIYGVGKLAGWW